MTDQHTNPADGNDPNRPSATGHPTEPIGAGNASGSQFPTGQPGEYAERDATPPHGQFGQPGEYSGGRGAQPSPSYGPPQAWPGAETHDPYGNASGPYPAAGFPAGQNPSGPHSTGQYGTGQYGTGPYGTGQYGTGQDGRGAATGSEGVGPFDEASFTEQPTRQPRPRTDENGEPYGVGPFTLREAIVAGLAFLLLIASFLPLIGGEYAEFVGYSNLWGPAPWLVIPGALLFIAAAALLVVRRLVPARRWRVGSLSVDQFASAAAIVTAGFHLGAILLMLGLGVWFGGLNEGFAPGAGPILGLIVSLAAVALTTFAVAIPPFAADFRDRPESAAHRLARDAKPVPQRPKPEAQSHAWNPQEAPNAATGTASTPVPTGATGPVEGWGRQEPSDPWPGAVIPEAATQQPIDNAPATSVYDLPPSAQDDTHHTPATRDASIATPSDERAADGPVVEFGDTASADEPTTSARAEEPVAAEPERAQPEVVEPATQQPAFAPYWVIAPEQRPVVDPASGTPLFEVGPTAWSLAVGEQDGGLVIRADDGRVGLLRDVDGLTRG